jgi:hypothetical protein
MIDHPPGLSSVSNITPLKPQHLITPPLNRVEIMADEQKGSAISLKSSKLFFTFCHKGSITDCEHFVDQKHAWIGMDRETKPEPHKHPGRIGSHRLVNNIAQLGKRDYFGEPLLNLPPGQAVHNTTQHDIFTARKIGVKSCTELDEGSDPPVYLNNATIGLVNTGDYFEKG